MLLCMAAKRAEVSAVLSMSAVHASDEAAIAVVVDIQPGLHAQSHTPHDKYLIPLTVKLDDNSNVAFGDAVYPVGEDKAYPLLGVLNVYTERAIVHVPINIKADAQAGPLKITGKVRLQICNDKSCFSPENIPFEVDTEVVAAGAPVQPNHPELFDAPVSGEASAPSTLPVAAPATAPTTAPAAGSISPPPVQSQTTSITFQHDAYLLAFGAAFLVGVLFNAMPCVLPVVPLKIMGFYEASQHDRGKSIALGAAFSAGLIASFGVLALLVVAFRVLDWGGLFQKTWFTIIIVSVLAVMAINLFGFFTVNLPAGIYRFTPRHDTYTGNFLFGVLTAALSTPCTFGLFVGLLAWALQQPVLIGVALIETVGIGMAWPYFVLSAFPELARKFPRTGPWSLVIKQMMAFLLLATAVYFAWPFLERFVSDRAIWWGEFGVIAGGGVFLVVRAVQLGTTMRPVLITSAIAVVLVAAALVITLRLTARPFEWIAYSEQSFQQATASGRPVLVDFTASWCGNCHWIEGFVLTDPQAIETLRQREVIMLKADVSDESAPAHDLLTKLSPAGAIPLTAVYLPGQVNPKLLDGIYTVDNLIQAVSQ